MKRIIAIAATAVCCMGNQLPAKADWGGGSSTTAAAAYCGARAQGESQKKASDRAASVLSRSMQGGFASNIATIIGGAKDMKAAINFQISQMCPQYYGANNGSKLTVTTDECNIANKKLLQKFIKIETPDC